MKLNLRSPGKVNLTLKILGRREDGFHELETLMCPLGIHDDVELEPRADGQIDLKVEGAADIPADASNLAWRAAELVQKKAQCSQGVNLVLRKRIPAGGGMAGGSSNAAVVLEGVNRLWGTGLSLAELKELAGQLGSDVAFFLEHGPCVCTGRGEITYPVALEVDAEVLLLNPGFGVPTPWAYQRYAARPGQGEEGRQLWTMVRDGVKTAFRLRNDLEPPVLEKYLWIAQARDWLRSQPGVLDAMMSGSGATVFALVRPGQSEGIAALARAYFGPNCWIQSTRLLLSNQESEWNDQSD